jgi:hypothetical protein
MRKVKHLEVEMDICQSLAQAEKMSKATWSWEGEEEINFTSSAKA